MVSDLKKHSFLIQNALKYNFKLMFQVRRVDSTAARVMAVKNIPPMVRESLLHHIPTCDGLGDNAIIKFWSMLYRQV